MGPGGFTKLLVVKRLRPEIVDSPEFLSMFLQEAKLSARLNHPNIVQTYEIGSDTASHFLTMEYLEGQSLHSILRAARLGPPPVVDLNASPPSDAGALSSKVLTNTLSGETSWPSSRSNGGLPLPFFLRALVEALEGLHYAHELCDHDGSPLHMVHRDVSPGNIFVTYEGTVKLLDFGIAKAADSALHTRTGMLKGKVAYMAPEQLRQSRELDRRADIFAGRDGAASLAGAQRSRSLDAPLEGAAATPERDRARRAPAPRADLLQGHGLRARRPPRDRRRAARRSRDTPRRARVGLGPRVRRVRHRPFRQPARGHPRLRSPQGRRTAHRPRPRRVAPLDAHAAARLVARRQPPWPPAHHHQPARLARATAFGRAPLRLARARHGWQRRRGQRHALGPRRSHGDALALERRADREPRGRADRRPDARGGGRFARRRPHLRRRRSRHGEPVLGRGARRRAQARSARRSPGLLAPDQVARVRAARRLGLLRARARGGKSSPRTAKPGPPPGRLARRAPTRHGLAARCAPRAEPAQRPQRHPHRSQLALVNAR
ncbi:MAG: serine/threonine protein kinase [Polyangiaceae bacterium]|nr:serine/threonine protein kinase [Polyangiaceae bacterium]